MMLLASGTTLYATWSNGTTTGSIRRSIDNGVTWTGLPDITLMGTNFCPDLAVDGTTGDLLYANEPNRQFARLPTGAPAWANIGSIGGGSAFTDFAGRGPWIYATGSINSVSRGPTAAGVPFTSVTQPVANSNNLRSMDADSAGNLYMSLNMSATQVRLYHWVAGAAALDVATVDLTAMGGGNAIPATATPGTAPASITAVYSAAANPIQVWVQTY
jgi:hypothetical protein